MWTMSTGTGVHHTAEGHEGPPPVDRAAAPIRVLVVGGVAGGMSAATRLRRLDETAEIIVVERSGHVSYANCGLPYFVGGVIEDQDDLLLQTPERLLERFRLDVRVDTEVVDIDATAHVATVRSTLDGTESQLGYDKLILSPGAEPVRPPIPGFGRVRSLRTVEDASRLFELVSAEPRSAVVIGAGFIGIETAENLSHAGIDVTLVEAAGQVLTPLDPEMAVLVEAELIAHGVHVETGVAVVEVTDSAVVLADGRSIPGELVVGSIGVRPDTRLALMAGIDIAPSGGIAVTGTGQTSDPDIYAVGDAVEKVDSVGGGHSLVALANVANRQGRRAADHIAGLDRLSAPSIGSAIVKVFTRTAAMTGWNEKRLQAAGRPYRCIHSHPMSHATYYPGAEQMSLKLIFDPVDGTILGAQAVGGAGVDKRIDILATALSAGMHAGALADLELAYAPPFSSAKDPVNMLGYMAENILSGECDVIEPSELPGLIDSGWTLVDVREPDEHAAGSIPGSINLPLDTLRREVTALGSGPIAVYCLVGQRGHTATEYLHRIGRVARNLDGGYKTWLAAEAARRGDAGLLVTPAS
jgi:NADPH-dependent 2,4-dienoyl-CoA reductase/sulfur reductase-like enzyme/rhodanese-related sulfurtransferase